MPKPRFERDNDVQRVPAAPEPSTTSAPEGMERARAMARRYCPTRCACLPALRYRHESEAALHTRMLAGMEIVAIAGGIPQATPTPPPYEEAGDGSAPD